MKDFEQLTPDVILDSVESLGYRCSGRILQLNSMENRVYEVELLLSEEEEQSLKSRYDKFVVVKFYRPKRWSSEQIHEEHNFMKILKDHEVPVVSPNTIKATQETLAKVANLDMWFTVFPKVGGRTDWEPNKEGLERIGRMLAQMHSCGKVVPAKTRLRLDPKTYGTDNLNYLLENKTLPLDLERPYKEAVEAVVKVAEEKYKNIELQAIHGDSHFGNVLWQQDGPYWVDFDDMVIGPKVQDIWLMVPGNDEKALSDRRILLEAYQTMNDFNPKELELVESLRALRFIHYATWVAKRWDDPYFKRAFSHFGTWEYWSGQLLDLTDQLKIM